MSNKALMLVLSFACAATSCGDDAAEAGDSRPDGSSDLADARAPEEDATTAGSGGTGSHDGGAGMTHTSPPVPTTCDPSAFAGGSCTACVADLCCAECWKTYCFANDYIACVGTCLADSSANEGGGSMSSLEQLVECGRSCDNNLDYVRRDLLACVSGTPRPVLMYNGGIMNWIEGEETDGGGVESCRSECFPSWETMP